MPTRRAPQPTHRLAGPFLLITILTAAVVVAACIVPAAPANVISAVATLTTDTSTTPTGSAATPSPTPEGAPTMAAASIPDPTAEREVEPIPLAAPANSPEQEFSAMAWYGDTLVLVPQFPMRNGNHLFTLPRAAIVAYLRGDVEGPLAPDLLPFNDGGLAGRVSGFEGYEAIAFDGDTVYMTVETRPGTWMLGYLVAGQIGPDGITLDPGQRTPIPTQAPLENMTDETLVIDGDRVLTIYEANGVNVNADAVANVFTRALEKGAPIPLDNVEYRITDATALDENRRFWAINYFWPGDEKLVPGPDAPAAAYGQGATHAVAQHVERLLEFQVSDARVTLVDTPPIQLRLLPAGVARNWEGLVRLQDDDIDGFLLVTDKFPVTQLAFVAR